MKIHLLEPFYGGSHKQWADGWKTHSRHHIELFTLPDRHWKWRMFGGAVKLAERWQNFREKPDMLVATDMLDLSTFLGLTRIVDIPTLLYFHENQLGYKWSDSDADTGNRSQRHYAFLNYTSALAADAVWFNSQFHKDSFLTELEAFLRAFPDYRGIDNIAKIDKKSKVMHLGLDFSSFEKFRIPKSTNRPKIILWNHRWEHDKDPESFFNMLFKLKSEGIDFQLVVLGEQYKNVPPAFAKAKETLRNEIIHWGYAKSREEYVQWLWKSDIIPVTSQQDFFGISVVEAMYCGCYPILPNRLAFPEHLTQVEKEKHLYESEEELYRKVKKLLITKDAIGYCSSLVQKYDWQVISPIYDQASESIIRTF